MIKILVIGNDGDRHATRQCMEQAGLDLAITETSDTTTGLLKGGEQADCVFVSANHSSSQVLSLLSKLAGQTNPATRVVVVTEPDCPTPATEFLRAGAAACLAKPDLTPDGLASLIRSCSSPPATKPTRPTSSAPRSQRDRGLSQAVLNSLSSRTAVLQADGEIAAVNEAWRAFVTDRDGDTLTDTEPGDNYLETCENEFPAPLAGEVRAGLESVLDGSAERFSLQYPARSQGRRRWFTMLVTPLADGEGGAVVSHTEITERKRAEQVIRESSRRLNLALAAADIATWSWVVEEDMFNADDRMHAMFGADPAALNGKLENLLSTHVHPDDVRGVEMAIARSLAVGNDIAVDFRVVRPDGATRHITATGAVIKNDEGAPNALSGVCLDTTDRREMEERLANERNLLRTVIDYLPDYIYAKDRQSRFLLCNKALLRTLGVDDSADTVNKSDADFFPKEYADRYYQDEQFIIQTGKPVISRYEPVVDESSQRKWLSTTKVPLRNDQGDIVGIVGMGRDITEIIETKDELEKIVKQLGRSNADLERFAFVASHDLQEPLRKVQSFAERLRTKYAGKLGDDGLEYLRRMEGSLGHMRNLLNGLLDVSRFMQEDENFALVDLSSIAQQVLYDLADQIEKRHAKVEVGSLPSLEANPVMMRALIRNLLDNALKFTRPGVNPTVTLRATTGRMQTGEDTRIEDPQEFCRLVVEDNGIGFDDRYLDQAFEIFRRLHRREEFEGAGVGLALCRRIAEQHRGTITAKSRPGAGSKFIVMLPLEQRRRRRSALAEPPEEPEDTTERIEVA